MARACTVCDHPEREAIDAAVTRGESSYVIAERFGASPSAIQRHARRHLSAALAAMDAPAQANGRAPLPDRIETLIERCETMFTAAALEGRTSQALAVVKELRACLELSGKATGELDTRPLTVVNLQTAPEWLAMRAVILSALMAYPEARACVSGRLLELEAGPS